MTSNDVHRLPPVRAQLLGAALALAGGLTLVMPAPPPAAAIGPLPACRVADIETIPNGYEQWSTTLVDWLLTVGPDYVPPDLVPTSRAGVDGGGLIRAVTIDDLRALAQAAEKAGYPISVISGFRSYRDQVASFNGWVAVDGYAQAITYSQRAGHSEHQLGLAIDFKAAGEASSLSYPDWATTPTGKWMFNNAWKYGWVLSYPWSSSHTLWNDAACFHYEPWHYRYYGRALAARIHASGLTTREYLWTHYTLVDTEGRPISSAMRTPSPTPTASPTPSPTPTVTPSPSAVPSDLAGGPPASGLVLTDQPLVAGGLLLLLVVAVGGIAVWRGRAGP